MDEIFQLRPQLQQEFAALLACILGDRDVIDWINGAPEFGNAEIVSLFLNRRVVSTLRIALDHFGESAIFVFELPPWIDVDVRGFSHQNVIGGLTLHHAKERDVQPWELEIGCHPGEWTIELGPCFGAYGTIHANVARIIIERAPDA